MYKFKLSSLLNKELYEKSNRKITEKEFQKKVEEKIEKKINKIDYLIYKNEVKEQTIIKKNNTLNKIFKEQLNIKMNKKTEEKLSKEIKTYIISKGYLQLDHNIITCKNNKVSIINKNI